MTPKTRPNDQPVRLLFEMTRGDNPRTAQGRQPPTHEAEDWLPGETARSSTCLCRATVQVGRAWVRVRQRGSREQRSGGCRDTGGVEAFADREQVAEHGYVVVQGSDGGAKRPTASSCLSRSASP